MNFSDSLVLYAKSTNFLRKHPQEQDSIDIHGWSGNISSNQYNLFVFVEVDGKWQ